MRVMSATWSQREEVTARCMTESAERPRTSRMSPTSARARREDGDNSAGPAEPRGPCFAGGAGPTAPRKVRTSGVAERRGWEVMPMRKIERA